MKKIIVALLVVAGMILAAWFATTLEPRETFGYVLLLLAAWMLVCILAAHEGKDF